MDTPTIRLHPARALRRRRRLDSNNKHLQRQVANSCDPLQLLDKASLPQGQDKASLPRPLLVAQDSHLRRLRAELDLPRLHQPQEWAK